MNFSSLKAGVSQVHMRPAGEVSILSSFIFIIHAEDFSRANMEITERRAGTSIYCSTGEEVRI